MCHKISKKLHLMEIETTAVRQGIKAAVKHNRAVFSKNKFKFVCGYVIIAVTFYYKILSKP